MDASAGEECHCISECRARIGTYREVLLVFIARSHLAIEYVEGEAPRPSMILFILFQLLDLVRDAACVPPRVVRIGSARLWRVGEAKEGAQRW